MEWCLTQGGFVPNVEVIRGIDPVRRHSVRTEPTQRRSTRRLDTLLDAAATIVDELGAERLTTQMVAERAGASIGTVYRYFPDRVAVLHALRERCIFRFRDEVANRLSQPPIRSWWSILETTLDVSVAMYRNEPGYVVVYGGWREISAVDNEPEFVHCLVALIEAEFGAVADSAELRFRIGVGLELGDALINRAFERSHTGDERYLHEAKQHVHDYLNSVIELTSGVRAEADESGSRASSAA
ncbi:MAG: hypothetical protein B5766_10450 [Candidatus Lumbricidophila eiseniae]|uniref:HTH tetR-type domain-containing protein n=1 Tax=Candidatus Lumbricidiphila eiseniae TaxID=1969409 RepID=A0A2A6FPI8_9MICO|nr:MAG: hypothetical protein B5766_10450 [Candidatus Lumbricidophila eiseniae]